MLSRRFTPALRPPQRPASHRVRLCAGQRVSVGVSPNRIGTPLGGLALYPDGFGDNVVRQRPNSGAASEIWTLEPQGQGLFRLILPSEGKGLVMTERGVKALPLSTTLSADQQWKLTPNGDQTYRISPQRPGNTGNLYYSTDYGLTTSANNTDTPARFRLEAATCPVQLPADCNIRIVAKDGTGTETTTLTRRPGTPGQFLPLTLTVESLDNSPMTGLSYAWATPASGTATTPGNTSLTADQRGDYKLQLAIPGLAQTCEAYVSLSAKPCTERKPTYASCRSVNVTNPDAANTLPLLQVGDTFNAADYTVTVTEVTPGSRSTGGAAGWSGTGTLEVTLLNGINLPVSVTFENAKLNDCYELVNGKVLTRYDPNWGNVLDVQSFVEDIKEAAAQVNLLLSNYKGTPEQVKTIQNTLIPLLTPYKDDVPQAASLIQKLDELSKQCKSTDGAALSDACKAKLAEIETDYKALQELIDELPPLPTDLFPGPVVNARGGRVAATDAPVVTVVDLNGIANAVCRQKIGNFGCKFPSDPNGIIAYYGNSVHPGYEFWVVVSGGKKYWVARTQDLSQVIYSWLPYEAKTGPYTVFYPEPGLTSGEAFADAGDRFVRDAGIMLITGGAESVSEVIVANFADAFISALDECNGDETVFYRSLATNLLWCGFDFADALKPALKNLFKYVGPNFAKFRDVAKARLATWKNTTGWFGELAAQQNKVPKSELPKYKKIVKGALSEALYKLSDIGAKVDFQKKQILDQGGKVIATIKDKSIQLTNKLVPSGWQKQKTLYDVEYEILANGVVQKKRGNLEVHQGSCISSPNARLAADNGCLIIIEAAIRSNRFETPKQWLDFVIDKRMTNAKYIFEKYAGKPFNLVGSGDTWNRIREKYKNVVQYDCFGFPDFLPFVLTEIAGKSFPKETFIVDLTKFGQMEGCQKDIPKCFDFTKANEEVVSRLNKLGIDIPIGTSFVKNEVDGIQYTWHHHQDGRHMMLVPSLVNNPARQGAPHAGGSAIVDKGIVGYFDDPFTTNHKISEPCK